MHFAVRYRLLQIIDMLWMEHLTAMDDMKAGIGLRAFGQRDPLTEYKSEAYRMFQSLLENIQGNLVSSVFRIQFVAQPVEAMPAGGPGPEMPAPANGAIALGSPPQDGGPAGAAATNGPLDGQPAEGAPIEMGAGARVAAPAAGGPDGPAPVPPAVSPALARRIAEFSQAPAVIRNATTNEEPRPRPQGRRPARPDGRAPTRSERNRQEAEAKKARQREMKRSREKGG
jgi:hypothetical protein